MAQDFAGGTNALVNNGTIQADVSGGTFTVTATGSAANAAITNTGSLLALNGATLNLNAPTTSSNLLAARSGGTLNLNGGITASGMSSEIDADGAGSAVNVNNVPITGGTLNETNGGAFAFSATNSNYLTGVTLNGDLNLTNGGRVRTSGGFTLNGTATLDNNAFLTVESTATLGGAGTAIVFGATGTNRLNVEGTTTLTLAAGTLVHGENGRIGGQDFVGGTSSLVNNGTIAADVSGGTFTFNFTSGSTTAITNNGTIAAQNGGTVVLNNNVTQSSGGQIRADGTGSTVVQNGVYFTGGTLATTGNGAIVPTNSTSNYLIGATLAGKLDLASGTAVERTTGGLTLNSATILPQAIPAAHHRRYRAAAGRRGLVLRREVQRDTVDAVAQAGLGGAVGEDVAEMPAALGTVHLGTDHAELAVDAGLDGARDLAEEARPAAAAVVLGARIVDGRAAAGAAVDAGALLEIQLAAAGALGAVLAQNVARLRAQLVVAEGNFGGGGVGHDRLLRKTDMGSYARAARASDRRCGCRCG